MLAECADSSVSSLGHFVTAEVHDVWLRDLREDCLRVAWFHKSVGLDSEIAHVIVRIVQSGGDLGEIMFASSLPVVLSPDSSQSSLRLRSQTLRHCAILAIYYDFIVRS